MKTCILDARTVSIARGLKVEQRHGANGDFESKDILVTIAVDRDYKVTRTENGKTVSEYPTDFWLAKFTGNLAQVFADYCTTTKEDGKLESRRLLLSGCFENYIKPRKVKKTLSRDVEIDGVCYTIEFEDEEIEIEDNRETIFVVDSMKFLDSKNTSSTNTTTSTSNGKVKITASNGKPSGNNTSTKVKVTGNTASGSQMRRVEKPNTDSKVEEVETPSVDPNFVPEENIAPF